MTPAQQQHLQDRHTRLVEATRRMRGYQIRWFRDHSSQDLNAAKKYEKIVDVLLKSEIDAEKQKQQEIF